MSTHLGKIVLMVVLSHGFRTLGRMSSPRWAGLALGLPCSTAVVLVGGGLDRGVEYAVGLSDASLLGLVGVVALPIAYAQAVLRGGRLPIAIVAGIGAYALVAFGLGLLVPAWGAPHLAVTLAAIVPAAILTGRRQVWVALVAERKTGISAPMVWALRTLVPILFLAASLRLGDLFGPEVSGLLSTFPGVSLTVLILTHLESGRASALKLAGALPSGNLGMVAFLAIFRYASPHFGLIVASILGYAATLLTLAIVIGLSIPAVHDRIASWRNGWSAARSQPSWPRAGRRFSPWIEPLAA